MSTTPILGLTLPADHSLNWGIPALNGDLTIIDTFAGTCIVDDPAASQTVTQPASTYLNINSLQAFGATPVIRFGVAVNVWDSAISRTAAGAFSFDSNTVGNSAASAKASVFNATAGFQVNSTAPSGFILVGNGTNFVASNTLPTGLGFYQTIQQAGTPVTQRRITNYLAPLTAVDDAGNGSTDVGLAASGVAAGTYTNPSITVNAKGLVTAVATGSVVATVNDVTGARLFNTTYQNTGSSPIYVSGYGQITGGSGDSQISCVLGPSSPTITVWAMTCAFTVAGEPCGFNMIVPAGYFYSVNVVHDISTTPVKWIETSLG